MPGFLKRRPYLLFVGPAVLIMAAMTIYPMVYGVGLSFFRYNLARPWIPRSFIGLRNFTDLIQDTYLLKSLWVTVKFALASVFLQLVLGLIIALGVHQGLKKASFFRFVVLLPMMIVPVVTGLVWRLMLNDSYGVINWMFQFVGLEPKIWLGPELALIMVIIVETWQWLPFSILLFSVGLTSIPVEYYETAAVDGANQWNRFIHITLPNLRWTFLIILVFKFSDAIKAFDVIYPLTGGGPGIATRTLALYIQNVGFTDFEMGYAMALSLLILCISFLVIGPFIFKMERYD